MAFWKYATKVGVGVTEPAPLAAPSAPADRAHSLGLRIESLALSNPELEAPRRTRVLLCGTYPIGQSNGYSRVVYYIARHLGLKEDVALTIYGFQNYQQTAGSDARTDIPASVVLHDALATEDPRRHGFGEKEIATFLRAHPQDVVVIFNDMVITTLLAQTIASELSPQERGAFKLVSYMDQVYPYQKPAFIKVLNDHFDAVIAFTPYWEGVVRSLGLRADMPTHVFPHGFDPERYFPIPCRFARAFFGLDEEAFVVLNLNRNQPRKRWDLTMMAWALVVKRHRDLVAASGPGARVPPMRLMIATTLEGYWNLWEIFEHELRLLGVPPEAGRAYIATVPRPQQMSDFEINVLYNACDVGLTTTDGEGFGLCTFEHLAVGKAQVAPFVGGFREFLHADNATVAEPRWAFYVDRQRDGIGGRPEVCDHREIAEGVWRYFEDPGLRARHGERGRREILQHYRWPTVVQHFHRVLKEIVAGPRAAP